MVSRPIRTTARPRRAPHERRSGKRPATSAPKPRIAAPRIEPQPPRLIAGATFSPLNPDRTHPGDERRVSVHQRNALNAARAKTRRTKVETCARMFRGYYGHTLFRKRLVSHVGCGLIPRAPHTTTHPAFGRFTTADTASGSFSLLCFTFLPRPSVFETAGTSGF